MHYQGHIVVVDDTPTAVELLTEILSAEGYTVSSANNGNSALELLSKVKPNLLLLDYRMPDINGFELYKLIKQQSKFAQTPVIFITAFTAPEYRTEGLQLGAVDFINKPIDKNELLLRIHTHMHISLLQSQLIDKNKELQDKISICEAEIETRKKVENQLILSQRRYKLLSDSTFEAIVIVDDNKITDESHQFNTIFGFTLHEIIDQSILNFIHPDDRDKLKGLIHTQTSETLECRGVTKNNEIIFLRINVKVLTDISRNCQLLVIDDNTQRKLIDDKIIRTIIETEEKERTKFSQEIHDGLGPLLSSIKMHVQCIGKPDAKTDKLELIKKTEETIDEAIEAVHGISFNLSPHLLNNFGLIPALRNFISRINDFSSISINLKTNTIERFGKIYEIIIYRIITECINNTIKHSGASAIEISFIFDKNRLSITFADNGSGFDLLDNNNITKGLGLLNMKSRIESIGGIILFQSSIGNGTKIFLEISV